MKTEVRVVLHRIVLFFILFELYGCAPAFYSKDCQMFCGRRLYSGPLRPSTEVALLVSGNGINLWSIRSEGEKEPRKLANNFMVELLPGRYIFGISYSKSTPYLHEIETEYAGPVEIEFDFRPGNIYIIIPQFYDIIDRDLTARIGPPPNAPAWAHTIWQPLVLNLNDYNAEECEKTRSCFNIDKVKKYIAEYMQSERLISRPGYEKHYLDTPNAPLASGQTLSPVSPSQSDKKPNTADTKSGSSIDKSKACPTGFVDRSKLNSGNESDKAEKIYDLFEQAKGQGVFIQDDSVVYASDRLNLTYEFSNFVNSQSSNQTYTDAILRWKLRSCKMAYLNINKILQNLTDAQDAKNRLQSEFKDWDNQLIMKDKLVKEGSYNSADLQVEKERFREAYLKRRETELKMLQTRLLDRIKKFANDKGYDLIITDKTDRVKVMERVVNLPDDTDIFLSFINSATRTEAMPTPATTTISPD